MTHIYIVYNWMTQERLIFYNDESFVNEDGSPTGTGLLQVDIYDPLGKFVGTFPEDGNGVGAPDEVVGDYSLCAEFTTNPVSMIELRVIDHTYRSYDDGRTWDRWE